MLDHFRINRKTLRPVFFLGAASLFITSCSDIKGDPLAFLAPGPPNQERPDTGDMTSGAAVHALAPEDPLVGLQPFQPLPGGMKGTLGLNLETYLTNNNESTDERVARLERVIIAMNKDMQAMAPALQKTDMPPPPAPPPPAVTMQPIMDAPQNLLDDDMQAEPPATPPIVTPVLTPPPAPAPQIVEQTVAVTETSPPAPCPSACLNAVAGTAAGTSLRVGEHPGMMRLVVDVSEDTAYSLDLDNGENILVIELPQADWSGPGAMNLDVGLVKSYKVEEANGGSMIVVQLTGTTSILSQTKMPAVSGNGRRIVIDLKR